MGNKYSIYNKAKIGKCAVYISKYPSGADYMVAGPGFLLKVLQHNSLISTLLKSMTGLELDRFEEC